MYTYADGALQSGVDVYNPTDHDITVEPDQDVAVVQFYTSVLTAVEFEFDSMSTSHVSLLPLGPLNTVAL